MTSTKVQSFHKSLSNFSIPRIVFLKLLECSPNFSIRLFPFKTHCLLNSTFILFSHFKHNRRFKHSFNSIFNKQFLNSIDCVFHFIPNQRNSHQLWRSLRGCHTNPDCNSVDPKFSFFAKFGHKLKDEVITSLDGNNIFLNAFESRFPPKFNDFCQTKDSSFDSDFNSNFDQHFSSNFVTDPICRPKERDKPLALQVRPPMPTPQHQFQLSKHVAAAHQ